MPMEKTRSSILALALCGALALALPGSPQAADVTVDADARSALALTVYNQDLALVVERRALELPDGQSRLTISDINPMITPGSLMLGGKGLRVIEQSARFDLLTPHRLLEASLGKTVRLALVNPATGEETIEEAKVLSVTDGVVLKIGDRIETSSGLPGRIVFDQIPPGLHEEPSLEALVEAEDAEEITLSYLTGGLTWQADYVARIDEDSGRLALSGLVTLVNNSPVRYEGARLRLVAGTVNVDRPVLQRARGVAAMAAPESAPAMAPEALGDLYLYDTGRAVSLAPRETKQIALITAEAIPVEREYRFEGLAGLLGRGGEVGPVKAETLLRFGNEEAEGLGKPLPAGTLRAYAQGSDDAPALFIGSDRVSHTAVGEKVEVALGQAFDITARAKQTDFEQLSKTSFEAAQEITIENAKTEAVTVKVTGQLPPNWRILEESAPHEQETAQRVAWTVSVPAGGETLLTYRVRVTRQ